MCNRKLFAFNHSRLGNLAGANLRGLACLREATVCLRSHQDMDREYQRKYSKFRFNTYYYQLATLPLRSTILKCSWAFLPPGIKTAQRRREGVSQNMYNRKCEFCKRLCFLCKKQEAPEPPRSCFEAQREIYFKRVLLFLFSFECVLWFNIVWWMTLRG